MRRPAERLFIMKISKVMRLANELKDDKLSTELKLQFINECEGMVQSEVMMLSSSDIIVYDENDLESALIVKPPHDKIYLAYLVAMIDYANNEYNKYANTISLFQSYFKEFHTWYFNRFHPGDGGAVTEGYYISAYSIAVKHGYQGTEEEWLSTMGGSDGKTVEMRYNSNTTDLEWKYTDETDDAWRLLIEVGDIVEASETAAQSAQIASAAAQSTASDSQSAKSAMQEAKASELTAASSAETAQASAQTASASALSAQNSAATAKSSENIAVTNATAAKSWAVGETGSREDEHINNAKYWSDRAQAIAGGDFAPRIHSHSKADITDFPETIPASPHTHVKADITNFPETMPPSAHTHTVGNITDFPATMPPSKHAHTIDEISDFPETMTPSAHTHNASDINEGTIDSSRLPTVPIAKGGTGATSATAARENLGAASAAHTHTPASIGAAPAYTYGTSDLTAGVSTLATGTLHFVYE